MQDDNQDEPAGPVSRLRWYPERGFELDLNAVVGEISIVLVAVPVPADGTGELRGDPLELDKLEILFKAQIDVSGAPGQLAEATVQFRSEGAEEVVLLEAIVEDAETGQTSSIKVSAPVVVPPQAPPSGGPRPKPADEADLDWDDDDTFEAMFKDPLTQEDPLPVAPRPSRDDDGDEDDLGSSAGDAPKPDGFDRLFKALLSADLEPAPSDDPAPPPTDSDEAPAPSLLAALLADDPPVDSAAMSDDPADARGLLGFLVEREQLELEPGHEVDELVAGAAPILASPKPPSARATALSEWLFDQDAVAELYIDDDSLAGLIEQW